MHRGLLAFDGFKRKAITEVHAGDQHRPPHQPPHHYENRKVKNAIIYSTPKFWPMSSVQMSEKLSGFAFRPCRPSEPYSHGFVLPAPHAEGFAHRIGHNIVLTLQTETKILPKSVVLRAVAELAAEIEKNECRLVFQKERKYLADVVTTNLLPRAFTVLSLVNAYIYPVDGRVVIDTASPKKADDFAELLKTIIPDNDIRPFKTVRRPAEGMTEWISGKIPDSLTVDDECILVRDDGEKQTVKYLHHPIDGKEISDHLSCGKRPTRLAMTCNDRASFVLTNNLHIRRFTLTDVVALEISEQDTKEGRFDAEIALYAGEMNLVINAIEEALGGLDSYGSDIEKAA